MENHKNALFFSSVDAISSDIWNSLHANENIYLQRDFLKSIEKNHPKINFLYLVLFDDHKVLKAFASIQIIDFCLDAIQNDLDFFQEKLKSIGEKMIFSSDKKTVKLLICGNTFVSGSHGVFINKNFDNKLVIKEIAKQILHYTTNNLSYTIDAFLFKDFQNNSLFFSDELKEFNYHPFLVEPTMILDLDDNWHTFHDYLASLKTKFRVKARKAFQLSETIKTQNVTPNTIEEQLPKMTDLYAKVTGKATFNLTDFNLDTYKDLQNTLGENYILKTYWLGAKMVGFTSAAIHKNTLDAHFVGIDYALNKQYAIYQRMLYDYIETAISKNLKTINFGRTASEIKSSVGAKPQDLTMYLRHKKGTKNKILKLFLQRVQPTPFQQKNPFKNTIN